ncbi:MULTISPECIES: DUF2892 domain-containing protein [Bacillaceae]|jgi:Protein of unknown function (DUF2892)|uniref:DUF2892 domain-containing protein n=1 Tax=Cytobacillus firmus TaxID=1399 RepID=A0AA46PV69_CYTFI|nr:MULTISPECIES: DUF2892 domain-containing protein [Bacillaceae]KML40128.1 hypothetical protein VL14_14495 [Cytobacillus firmus]MBG9585899.1 hypothetical protein [Cytobacillus firmus]MCC3649597.1 DUF2892 domain-containing protein [Cytobacillus oceanisediminis]MCU1808383.1 DUF2892 domain-containing protein [Cytobacillus firmus]UYG97767.1 DUF2892 domain-containing protein [Cytobacillus firmus]
MHVKSNIGIVNALIRITVGLTVLAWSTSKLVKRPWRDSYLVMAMLGGMKVAEGIVRFCPLTALFERGQDMVQEKRVNHNNNDEAVEEILPYNPS